MEELLGHDRRKDMFYKETFMSLQYQCQHIVAVRGKVVSVRFPRSLGKMTLHVSYICCVYLLSLL